MYLKKWEEIDGYSDRLKVPGGWIVRSYDLGLGSVHDAKTLHQIFISDSGHTWKFDNQ